VPCAVRVGVGHGWLGAGLDLQHIDAAQHLRADAAGLVIEGLAVMRVADAEGAWDLGRKDVQRNGARLGLGRGDMFVIGDVPADEMAAGAEQQVQQAQALDLGHAPGGDPLAAHLVFWNRQQLAKFNGQPPEAFSGDNNETFNSFDPAKWAQIKKDLDQVMKDWEDAVQKADDAKIAESASTIAHIGAHNAYHIGQMVYIRKLQGSWDPEKGVK